MNDQTFNRRFKQLVTLVTLHPYREELLQIMANQVADDTEFVTNTSQ